MVYLLGTDAADRPAGVRFRDLLDRPGILQMPGAHNGMAALQARDAGFPALYLSGAAMTASMGLPDLGIITIEEVAFFIRQVARASGLPVLVDGDTGYGEALNVMNMVRTFEDAGAAAVHIEDQLLPKKCGHLNDKKLADARDMAAKVAAAAKARRHLYLIARTDAAASEGHGRRGRARQTLSGGGSGRDLPGSDDFARDVPGVRQARSRRSAAREHDRVRQDAVLHRVRVRGDGLSHGDLAGVVAPRRQQGPAESVRRPQARRQHPQRCSTRCRRAPSFTQRSDCTITRRSMLPSSRPSSPKACRRPELLRWPNVVHLD